MSDDHKRELGMGMPIPARNLADERFTVRHISPKPDEPRKISYQMVAGIIMINEDGAWRLATAEEIEQLTGGVM